jgi:hypothetical protein
MSTDNNMESVQQTAAAVEGHPEVALPAPYQDEFLESLTGEWAGVYVFGGVEFQSTADVRWAFNHQFVRGVNLSRGSIGLSETQEIWQPTSEKGMYKVWWFDSWGNAGIANGKETETGFVIYGSDPLFGSFRNTGTKNGSEELRFQLDNGPDEDGNYTPLGSGYYRRVTKA